MSMDHIMLKSESSAFVSFSMDGIDYSMRIHHERTHEEDNVNQMQESVSADIKVGAKKITLVKSKNGDSLPTFNISGEGPELEEEMQCKIVLANWISVVIRQIDAWQESQDQTEDAMREFLSPIINFMLMFNHFFGDYVADIARVYVDVGGEASTTDNPPLSSGPSENSSSGNNDQVSASQNDNECPYFPETPATRKEDDVKADEDIPAVVEQKVLVNGVPFVDGVGAPTPEENSVAENNENIEQTSSVTYSSILNKSKEIDVPASDTTAAEDVATTNTVDNGSTHVEDSVSTSTTETGKKSDEEGSDTTTDSDMPLIMEEDKTNGN